MGNCLDLSVVAIGLTTINRIDNWYKVNQMTLCEKKEVLPIN